MRNQQIQHLLYADNFLFFKTNTLKRKDNIHYIKTRTKQNNFKEINFLFFFK